MTDRAKILTASPFQNDVLALPVSDLDQASDWYQKNFGFNEVERKDDPNPTVLMERDEVRLGFALNDLNPEEEGAALRVTDIHAMRDELEGKGIETGNWRVDDWDGEKFQVFFVVAPDRLCYVFTQPLSEISDKE